VSDSGEALPILVVDDEPQYLATVKITLQMARLGEVEVCEDSREVLDRLGARRHSVMLLDLSMPHMTGSEIIEAVHVRHPDLAVIVLTASTNLEDVAHSLSHGAYDYLLKPVDKSRLITSVRRAMTFQRVHRENLLLKDLLLSDRFDALGRATSAQSASDDWKLLKTVREEYRMLFSSLLVPTFVAEASDLSVKYANRAFLAFMGLPDRGADAVESHSLLRWLDERSCNALLDAVARGSTIDGLELQGDREGRTQTVLMSIRCSRDTGYVEGSFLDITERKTLEERLVQAQKMDALGRMAGSVAHDFNNILTALNGHLALLADEPLSESARGTVRELQSIYQRGADLTRQLLAVGGRQAPPREPQDVHAVLRNLQGMLAPMLGRHVTLHLETRAERSVILASRMQVEQVFLNLLINARDAMPEGGTICVTTSSVILGPDQTHSMPGLATGRYLRVGVRDNGQGMDAETQRRIFEPFFTTKAPGKGTGLGLSTVFSIVSAASGGIEVRSAPGQGAEFITYWPEAAQPRTDARSPASLSSACPGSIDQGEPERHGGAAPFGGDKVDPALVLLERRPDQ
jgi:signal transduction histidine kinase/FixJ family two-component response regulator